VEYEIVIGLEIHAQLLTETKIFCPCRSAFGEEPNANGCPVCLGMPGALPVLNRAAVEKAILMGCAVNCCIAHRSIFARKNYFYPDLPKGYQISQYELPLCGRGAITIDIDGAGKSIGITRIHLEEDAGKLIHDQDTGTLFDVNRCGTPLIEIVSEPDMRSAQEAYAYLCEIRRILQYLGICDCNMEEGSLRCDANISLRPRGERRFGTKTELKNMNTFRGVEKAIEYEAQRQRDVLDSGGQVVQETFLWDAAANRTVSMRTKESAPDYRYFPDPDLVPLIVSDAWIDAVRRTLPELPQARRRRFAAALGLNPEHAEVLADTREVADYFEETLKHYSDVKQAANWVMGEVLRTAKEQRQNVARLKITPPRLARLLGLVSDGTISPLAAKKVISAIQEKDKEPAAIIEELGLTQITDLSQLELYVSEVIAQNPKEAERYKSGDKKLLGFFVGQVMKAARGKGNPKEINRLLMERLS
jgi:aspartyl-tRNA(Asn)/glutamyl-tRNA(Gln) amidotransferase subunit B